MKIKLFYFVLPFEAACRYPLGVMIYTYWMKTKKKKKTATILAPAGERFNEIQWDEI